MTRIMQEISTEKITQKWNPIRKPRAFKNVGEVKVPANDLQVWSMKKLLTELTSCFKITIWKYASSVDEKSSLN